MNNNLLNIITSKERKKYNRIIQSIEQKDYNTLFDADIDHTFKLSNQKYINNILNRIEQEVCNNPELLIKMIQSDYHKTDYFSKIAIKVNPKIVESLIEQNISVSPRFISIALDSVYNPSSDYINSHFKSFSSTQIMKKLVAKGYRPTNEMMESSSYMTIFKNEKLFIKALD